MQALHRLLRPLAGLAFAALLAAPEALARTPQFGIYTAHRNGDGFGLILGSEDREMTHPRVSPDLRRIVFTRYNRRGPDGLATEQQGYEETEIVVMDAEGGGVEVVVPSAPGVIAANAEWTPDGRGIQYLSTDNPWRWPQVRVIDLETRALSVVPTPPALPVSDPNRGAAAYVFPVKASDDAAGDALWTMDLDGGNARQLTSPPRSSAWPGFYGDFDPKLSPDGSKVAFMRIDGGIGWRVMVVDVATGQETPLTPPGAIQGLPTWGSDGARLLYMQWDFEARANTGLYTMASDGSDRVRVPLPSGFLYGHGSWFPLEGSSPDARIVFTATRNPWF